MKNIDLIKELSATDLAFLFCVDIDGEMRSCCPICMRYKQGNCDDRCIQGVEEWLESEAEE